MESTSTTYRKSMYTRRPCMISVKISHVGGKKSVYFEETDYNEFMIIVERIATILSRYKNCLIGIAIEKSPLYIAICRSVLISGNAFISLPLDSEEYTWQLCERFKVNCVISKSRFTSWDCEWRCFRTLKLCFTFIHKDHCNFIENERIAYAIQTSGTTGEPKVIHVPYSCIVPNIIDFIHRFNIHEESWVLFLTSLYFDPSIVELFLHLFTHCNIVIVPDEVRTHPFLLQQVLSRFNLDFVQLTSSLLKLLDFQFLQAELFGPFSKVSVLAIGGENFPINFIRSVRSPFCPMRIINLYGVTEVSCWASAMEVEFKTVKIHVGEPLLSTRISIFENKLLISGRNCAIDFTTNQQFKTSDEATLILDDDNRLAISITGRSKPSGIKPMIEIEDYIINRYPNVTFAKLLFLETSRVLVLQQVPCTPPICLKQLKKEFPSHYCPTRIVILHSNIPVTRNGKVDNDAMEKMIQTHVQVENASFISTILRDHYDIHKKPDSNITLNSLGIDSLAAADMAYTFAKILKPPFNDAYYFMKFILNHTTTIADLYRVLTAKNIDAFQPIRDNTNGSSHSEALSVPTKTFQAIEMWHWNSKKCIDASPVLHNRMVYVGSHSGKFVGIDLNSGNVILNVKFNGRIQGTCAVCDLYIAFGTFNGDIHLVDIKTQSLVNTFKGDGQIKMTPLFEKEHLYFGTYNESFYKIHVIKSVEIWRQKLSGNILSRPVAFGLLVIVATQAAIVFGLDNANGEIRWKLNTNAPIFADLLINRESVIVVDVNGGIYVVDAYNGSLICSYQTNQVSFAPPLLLSNGNFLLASNHGFIYYFSCKLELLQTFHVHATFVQPPVRLGNYIFLMDTSKKARLLRFKFDDINPNTVIQTDSEEIILTLPAESFGLPIINYLDKNLGSYEIIAGCRDDCLRKFNLIPLK